MATDNKGGGVAKMLLRIVFLASMVGLSVFLFNECGGGRKAIEAYAASVRAGAEVTHAVAGDEAPALAEALEKSTSVSVNNFQAQAGTACFWVTLEGKASTDARFVLRSVNDDWAVHRASLKHGCHCPENHKKACHLR